jgi:hypothetical protein
VTAEGEQLPLPGLARPEDDRVEDRQQDPLGGRSVDAATARRLTRSAGRGRTLSPEIRQPLEAAFDADFSRVSVHTDSNAERLARDVQATAFTHGNDIYFGRGAYDPGSARGRHVLAHELTHVVQHQQGRDAASATGTGPVIGRSDDPAETEAEHTAHDVLGALRRQADLVGPARAVDSARDAERE